MRELEFLDEIAQIACCKDVGVSGSRVVGGLVPVRGGLRGRPRGIAIDVPLDWRGTPAQGINSSTVRTWEAFSTSCGLWHNRKVVKAKQISMLKGRKGSTTVLNASGRNVSVVNHEDMLLEEAEPRR